MSVNGRTIEPSIAKGLSELDVLALTLHHEAYGEGITGMFAVGCVLRNRRAWGKWGPTLRNVCLAPKQFSCWRPAGGTTNYTRLVTHAEALRAGQRPGLLAKAFGVAYAMLDEVVDDVTAGADHYWAPNAMVPKGATPKWAVGITPTAHIGGHIFIRLRPVAADGVVRAR